VGKGLVSEAAVVVEMAGDEYQGIKGMDMTMNESAGEGLPDTKKSPVCSSAP
jgi:hypothetical protein